MTDDYESDTFTRKVGTRKVNLAGQMLKTRLKWFCAEKSVLEFKITARQEFLQSPGTSCFPACTLLKRQSVTQILILPARVMPEIEGGLSSLSVNASHAIEKQSAYTFSTEQAAHGTEQGLCRNAAYQYISNFVDI